MDKKYPQDQVAALDNAATAPFSEGRKLYLFTDSDFVNLYKENGGKMTISPFLCFGVASGMKRRSAAWHPQTQNIMKATRYELPILLLTDRSGARLQNGFVHITFKRHMGGRLVLWSEMV